MKWIKKGLIYKPDGDKYWNKSHAQVPTAMLIADDVIRIFYCSRDLDNRSYTSYIDVDAFNPSNIIYIHNEPILEFGFNNEDNFVVLVGIPIKKEILQ